MSLQQRFDILKQSDTQRLRLVQEVDELTQKQSELMAALKQSSEEATQVRRKYDLHVAELKDTNSQFEQTSLKNRQLSDENKHLTVLVERY